VRAPWKENHWNCSSWHILQVLHWGIWWPFIKSERREDKVNCLARYTKKWAQNKYKQDRECTCNAPWRCVHPTIVAVENQLVLHNVSAVCSLRHPAYNVHAPYYIVICGLPSSTIFFHVINGTCFWKKKLLNIKRVFDFLYNFCLRHFSF
jgi:hypothetical protein